MPQPAPPEPVSKPACVAKATTCVKEPNALANQKSDLPPLHTSHQLAVSSSALEDLLRLCEDDFHAVQKGELKSAAPIHSDLDRYRRPQDGVLQRCNNSSAFYNAPTDFTSNKLKEFELEDQGQKGPLENYVKHDNHKRDRFTGFGDTPISYLAPVDKIPMLTDYHRITEPQNRCWNAPELDQLRYFEKDSARDKRRSISPGLYDERDGFSAQALYDIERQSNRTDIAVRNPRFETFRGPHMVARPVLGFVQSEKIEIDTNPKGFWKPQRW
jgi:hypothetical protein